MDIDRWHRVAHLFQTAMELEPGQRALFLADSTGGDEELRREVEEMLALEERHQDFLEQPAVEIALARDGITTGRLRQTFEEALARKTADSAREFRLNPGTRLGPYEILAPAGAGGMGEIYRARDTRLGREVALKILAGRLMEQAGIRRRFEAEAQAISSLNHPNICTLYDIGHHEDVDYLVMEYLEGQTLAERLKQGPVPYPDLLRLAIEVSGALAYSHERGVIHRDVKPGNIMLTAFGSKLLDFGLARWEQEAEVLGAIPLIADSSVSVTGLILGTPQYMAPEQIERSEIDARTDIFALGAVLFEMAAGRKAFEGHSSGDVIRSILAGEGPKAGSLRSVMPEDLAEAIGTCLRTRPEERWQSAAELHRTLTRLASPERPWLPPRLAKAARTFVIAAALLGLSVEIGDHGPPRLQRVQFRDDTKFEILHSFPTNKERRGTAPSGLLAGSRGVLYGTSAGGGEAWGGTVFELDPPLESGAPWSHTVLYAFTGGADGAGPDGGLIEGPGGRLYGTTTFGGAAGNGTVFELTPPESPGRAWSEKVLHHFTRQGGDGCAPHGTLVFGPNGELYGTTMSGGIPGQGSGTVFQLTPPATPRGQWTEKVLHKFTGAIDGANPEADLILDNAGALYGATSCSTPDGGLVFKLEPPAMPGGEWKETNLHRFTGENGAGICSTGGLYFGPDGALYGTATQGQAGLGSVFELRPPSTPGGQWTETVLSLFTGQNGDGSDVIGGLAVGPDGAFYGATAGGGRWGAGVIFELKPPAAPGGTWTKIVLHSLNGRLEGMYPGPLPHLVFEKNRTLYGANRLVGPEDGGTVFQLKF